MNNKIKRKTKESWYLYYRKKKEEKVAEIGSISHPNLYKQDLDSNWPLNQNKTRERACVCVWWVFVF
jgi:hypothetical protein